MYARLNVKVTLSVSQFEVELGTDMSGDNLLTWYLCTHEMEVTKFVYSTDNSPMANFSNGHLTGQVVWNTRIEVCRFRELDSAVIDKTGTS